MIHAHLVDFIEQKQRIAHAGLRHFLHDLARQRADIGATMTANLRFIAHAAQRHAHKLAIGRLRNRFAERRFTNAGRADQAQHRALDFLHALLHREIFEDAIFDLFQTVVVALENLLGVTPDPA